jgi:hypothetical protein
MKEDVMRETFIMLEAYEKFIQNFGQAFWMDVTQA